MKVDIHINGRITLELTPTTDLERLVLAEMLSAAEKGQSVTVARGGVDSALISVAK